MKTNKQKLNWIIDAVLFAAFIICFLSDLTGLMAHQILGIVIAVLCALHFILHWTWVKSVTVRFFRRTSRQARNFYIADIGLTLGLATMLITGLFITTWFELAPLHYVTCKDIHVISAFITLLLLIVKVGMHWRWIVNIAHRRIFTRKSIGAKELRPQPAAVSYDNDRRSFLKLMGATGLLAALALGSSMDGLMNALISQTSSSTASSTGTSSNGHSNGHNPGSDASSSASTTDSCVVLCPEGCSYPGRCRRYIDTNHNNLCDLGECM